MMMMNCDEFMREFARCTKTEGDIDLPDEILRNRADFLFVVYELLMGKLTPSELKRAYIILAGLLLGKYPKIAFSVRKSDRIRLPFAALEKLLSTKGKLTEREKLLFAFCAFYSVCVEVYDENTNEIHKGITDITSREKAMWLFVGDMENHPERYAFLDAPKKTRPENSAPFGTSIENPIQAVSVADSYSYLNSLRTPDGKPVPYKRIGSMAGGVNGIIDGYLLYLGSREMTVYIDPYAVENSAKAPEGLMLAGNERGNEIQPPIINTEIADSKTLFELGMKYYYGEGVMKNPKKAAELWRKAAEKGHTSAQFNLGLVVYNGDGVTQDYGEAFKWYSLAAQKGHLKAQTNLGLMYSKGYGVKQDYREALKWYSLAADKGLAEAQHDLGFMYYSGEGVPRDIRRAVSLWRKAAEQGYADSQNNLGFLYRTGYGVKQDYREALKWCRLAAEQGNAESQNDLGEMYENGEGVRRDISEALKWYRLAAENGSENSLMALQRLGVH